MTRVLIAGGLLALLSAACSSPSERSSGATGIGGEGVL